MANKFLNGLNILTAGLQKGNKLCWKIAKIDAASLIPIRLPGTRFIDIEVAICRLFVCHGKEGGSWEVARLLRHGSIPTPDVVHWLACETIFFSSSSFSACKLKLAPFCIGGNSSAV